MISVVAAVMCAHAAQADMQAWYETPRVLSAGVTVLDTVPQGAHTMRVHVRVAAARWSMEWDRRSPSDLWRATMELEHDDSDVYSPVARITVEQVTAGVPRVVDVKEFTNGFDCLGGENSMVYIDDGVSARLYAGHDDPVEVMRLPVQEHGGEVAVGVPSEARCRRVSVESAVRSPLQAYTGASDADALLRALSQSADANAGVWEYLDREMDASKASMSVGLCIATVPDGDGGYVIVYLGGETIGMFDRPMLVKGRLRPTIFTGEYDMEWITADGKTLASDVSAAVSADHAILTLRFPLLNTKVRMRRRIIRPGE